MMKYNESLQKAGVLLALDGLHPPSMGARVSFAGGKPKVTDGPFAEAKEVLGGYWMIQVRSREEAIAWASRCPASENEMIEVRQVQEFEDFPADVQKAAAGLQSMQPQPARALKEQPCAGPEDSRGARRRRRRSRCCVLASFEPDMFRVQRSTTIAAPAAKVFPLIDDFRRWTAWSPFEKMDPTMKRTYGTPAAGPGATYAWDGEGQAGARQDDDRGVRAAVARSASCSSSRGRSRTARPRRSRSCRRATRPLVTWSMQSPSPFIAKVMHVFFDAEKLVGDDFARGLADLKAVAEK